MKFKKILLILFSIFSLSSCSNINSNNSEHDYEITIINPTCTTSGYTLLKCKDCGKEIKNNLRSPLGHIYVEHNETKPTLDTSGIHKYFTCSRCGSYFDSQMNPTTAENLKYNLSIYDLKDSVDPVFFLGHEISITEDFSDVEKAVSNGLKIYEKMKSRVASYNEITEALDKCSNLFSSTSENYEKISLLSDIYNYPEYYDLKTTAYSKLMDLYSIYYKMLAEIMNDPSYKRTFLPLWTKDEIDNYLESIQLYVNDNAIEANSKMEQALSDYKAGKQNRFSAYSTYVENSKILSNELGYNNYLEYAYENVYQRDYTIENTSVLKSYIKDYIAPLYKDVCEKIDKIERQTYKQEYREAIINVTGKKESFYGCVFDELYSYAKYIGGGYLTNFKKYFREENYYYSNLDNNNITAYVTRIGNTPIMFMSKHYQNFTTFIHEFGHYNSEFTFGRVGSYDLAETQSQGNELMFYTYLDKNNYFNNYESDYFLLTSAKSMIETIMLGYMINEVEKYTYLGDFTKESLEELWLEIGEEIDFVRDINYLYLVLLNYQGYYISYAMSAVASLEIFAKALINLDEGKESYISIFTKEDNEKTFSDCLKNANLYNVFDKEAYELISTISSLL